MRRIVMRRGDGGIQCRCCSCKLQAVRVPAQALNAGSMRQHRSRVRPRAVQIASQRGCKLCPALRFSIMTKSIDLLALIEIRVGMPQGP